MFLDLTDKHITILGLGPSVNAYTDHVKRLGGRGAYCDEVWAINAAAGVFQHDRMFHMDDVRVQEARAEAGNKQIKRMLSFMRNHPGPIYTSHLSPDYSGLVPFPLGAFWREFGRVYFNSTAAYAVAFAIACKVKRISIFGCDFSYAQSHAAERGRACVEYWLGVAEERGIAVSLPHNTSLFDTIDGWDARLYGYDGYEISIKDGEVRLTDRPLPSASEIERRYDHTQPTSTHVARVVTEANCERDRLEVQTSEAGNSDD